METNSPADTDHSLPSEEATSNNSANLAEGAAIADAAAEQQAAAVEAVPEPMPELSAVEPTSETTAPAETPEISEQITESPGEQEAENTVAAEAAESTDADAQTEGAAAPDESTAAPEPGEQDPLDGLAEQSQRARLSAPDEERAATLLKEALLDGRAGVTRSVAILPKLPWIIGVAAVTAVWKDMKSAFRTQLLSGLSKNETDGARRMRLSLARGLFKVDVPTALKLAVAVAKEMRDKETGALTPRNAQIFANVLIGRAKPWIAQIPLNDLKPAEADLLVHCALIASFSVPHAPVTQLGILKWAAEAGRLNKLHDLALENTTRGLSRWSGKWQSALRKEVTDLPEAIVNSLKAPAGPQPGADEAAPQEKRQRPDGGQRKAPEPEPAKEAVEVPTAPEDSDEEDEDEDEEDDDEREDSTEEVRPADRRGGGREQARPRPVYESKTVPRKQGPDQQPPQQPQRGQAPTRGGGGSFDLRETLRQIESHVASLRTELVSTQNKLRQREQDSTKSKRGPDRAAAPIIPGEPTPDELARLNQQLEARNAELQQRIHELTQDSEDRAASMGIHGSEPVEQPDAQLRTLLAYKLQEDFEDFAALEKEKPDLVVQQHYRTVLRHVLEVLRQEGVQFQVPKGD